MTGAGGQIPLPRRCSLTACVLSFDLAPFSSDSGQQRFARALAEQPRHPIVPTVCVRNPPTCRIRRRPDRRCSPSSRAACRHDGLHRRPRCCLPGCTPRALCCCCCCCCCRCWCAPRCARRHDRCALRHRPWLWPPPPRASASACAPACESSRPASQLAARPQGRAGRNPPRGCIAP